MYNITINYRIGEYIKDRKGDVFEITELALKVVFDPNVGKEKAIVQLSLVDPRDSEGTLHIMPVGDIMKATEEEVDDYILNNKKASVPAPAPQPRDGTQEDIQQKHLQEKKRQTSAAKNYKVVNKDTDWEPKERTVDTILDEINDYKVLIEMFGTRDKSGKEYKKKIESLKSELKEKTRN